MTKECSVTSCKRKDPLRCTQFPHLSWESLQAWLYPQPCYGNPCLSLRHLPAPCRLEMSTSQNPQDLSQTVMLLQAGLCKLEIIGLRCSPMVHHLPSTHEALGTILSDTVRILKENSSPIPSLGMQLGFLFPVWDLYFSCPEERHHGTLVWTHPALQQDSQSLGEWAPLYPSAEQVPKSSPSPKLPFLPLLLHFFRGLPDPALEMILYRPVLLFVTGELPLTSEDSAL